jgi:2-iminobutanoate/2-iminopropanoate deaminase
VGPYAQAVVAGSLVFASGQIPLDPRTGKLVAGEIEAQTERVLENLRAVLERRLPLDRVVPASTWSISLFAHERRTALLDSRPCPARATIQAAAALGAQIEIDAIALNAIQSGRADAPLQLHAFAARASAGYRPVAPGSR